MKKKNNKGFSLVELIVVITIMAVLMVTLAPAMLRYVEKSRVQKDKTAVAEVINAVNHALAEEEVNATVQEGDTVSCSNGTITSSRAELLDEIHKLIPDDSFKLTSKTYSTGTYTIKIVDSGDGVVLQAESYDDSHW